VGGAIGGAAGGYAGGFTAGYLTTGNLKTANQSGLSGLVTGAGIGGAVGGAAGYRQAVKSNINPWTGRPNNSVTIGEGMQGVKNVAGDLGSKTIPDKPGAYFGKEISPNTKYSTSEFMEYNAEWIEIQMESNAYIYDIGPTGTNSPYYNMKVGRTMVYPKVYNVYQIQQIQTIRILIIYK
jgi:hypothetical protein